MGRRHRRHAALILSAVLTAIAVIDAGRERTWDVVVILAAALALQVGVLTLGGRTRVEVALRADLRHWMAQRAEATGEDLDHFADRCVAAYRAGLTVSHGTPDEAETHQATASTGGRGRHAAAPVPAARGDRSKL